MVLHLLYARFITMALKDLGYINFEEPFEKFRAHGLLIKDGAKMSKSRGNVVNPDEYFESYGADVMRMYLMFLGPFEEGGDWQDQGIRGISRFAKRVWTLCVENKESDSSSDINLQRAMHKTVKKVTNDVANLQYNTAISALMEYVNALIAKPHAINQEYKETLVNLLAPFAPHLTEELWEQFGHKDSVHDQPWPVYNEAMLAKVTVIIPVQINGKLRGSVEVASDISEEELKKKVQENVNVKKWLKGKEVKKWIVVPGKLVNVVVL